MTGADSILAIGATILGLLAVLWFRSIGDSIAEFYESYLARAASRIPIIRLNFSRFLCRIGALVGGLFLLSSGIASLVSR